MAVNDGDVVKVVVTIDAPDVQIAQNVFYWRLDDPTPDNPSTAQIISALDVKMTALCDDIKGVMNTGYDFDEFTAEKVEWNGTYWETTENLGVQDLSISGTSATHAVPHAVAGVITGKTSRPQTRARKFIAGLLEPNVDDSTLESPIITALTAYAVEWLANQGIIGSAALVPVVLGQSGPSAGLIYALLTAAIAGVVGSQRSRKPGVGI